MNRKLLFTGLALSLVLLGAGIMLLVMQWRDTVSVEPLYIEPPNPSEEHFIRDAEAGI